MTRGAVVLLGLLVGACGPAFGHSDADDGAQGYDLSAPRTICGDEAADELEPALGEMLEVAVSYWHDQGLDSITLGNRAVAKCDIRVVFEPEVGRVKWATDQSGVARPGRVYLRAQNWQLLMDHGLGELILTHEIGHHLLGIGHTETGVMSPTAGL